MWLLANSVFWSSLGIVLYTYGGYPVLVFLASRLRSSKRHGEYRPNISIVMAARNESKRIGAKLDNLLGLDYPKDQLQIVVVDDGSTDDTAQVVRSYGDQNVVLVDSEVPVGKSAALNLGVNRATGEILVFCDVRQRVDAKALTALADCFSAPKVGAASGELFIDSAQGPGVYWKYEKFIRACEGRLDSIPGATGALYAIRRALFVNLPRELLLDDVFTPMQIVLQGFRVVLEPAAKVFDDEADLSGEFQRKARTLAGNFQILSHLPGLLNPFKNRIFWQYGSHKLMRLVCPIALVGLLGSNAALVASLAPGWPFYATTLCGQLGLYALAINGALRGDRADRLSRVANTFVVLNAAAVAGFARFLKGDFTWTRAK